MSIPFRLALGGAVATSAIALTDAATRGLTGQDSVFADSYGVTWQMLLGNAVHGLTYLAFAVLLVHEAARLDAVGTWTRRVRRVLVLTFGFMALAFLVLFPLMELLDSVVVDAFGAAGGISFLLMFLFSSALGVTLVRRPEFRPAAVLLCSVVPVILLTVALALAPFASGFAHPAYAETAVHFGIALLGYRAAGTVTRGATRTDGRPVATEPAR